MCYRMATMKTATLRELHSRHASVVKWIESGEVVKISKDGKIIARLVPEKPGRKRRVTRSTRTRVTAKKAKFPLITEEHRAALFDE